MKERGKYQAMYKATLKIQALFRGRITFWKYQRARLKRIQERSARLIQRVVRGHHGRKKANKIKIGAKKIVAAIKFQCMVRSKLARSRVMKLKREKRIDKLVRKLQAVIRGVLTRKNLHKIAEEMYKMKVIIHIQKRVRGMISRLNLARKKAQMEKYRAFRIQCAVSIQKVIIIVSSHTCDIFLPHTVTTT